VFTTEELMAQNLVAGKTKLVIDSQSVLVLSNEWLEKPYCAICDQKD
jgi:hypothetical protein